MRIRTQLTEIALSEDLYSNSAHNCTLYTTTAEMYTVHSTQFIHDFSEILMFIMSISSKCCKFLNKFHKFHIGRQRQFCSFLPISVLLTTTEMMVLEMKRFISLIFCPFAFITQKLLLFQAKPFI